MNIKLPLQIIPIEDTTQTIYIIEDSGGQKVSETYDENLANIILSSITIEEKQNINKENCLDNYQKQEQELQLKYKAILDKPLEELITNLKGDTDVSLVIDEEEFLCPMDLGFSNEVGTENTERCDFYNDNCTECWINTFKKYKKGIKTQL